jgi:hypothetical protein
MEEPLSGQELKANEAFMEKIRTEEPNRSCDKVRAWMKLNIEASTCPVWNN